MNPQAQPPAHRQPRMTIGGEIVGRQRHAEAPLAARLRINTTRQQAPQSAASAVAAAGRPVQAPQTAAALAQSPSLRREFQPPPPAEKPARSLYQKLQLPAVVLLGIIAGVLVQSPQVGQLLIVGYGIVAFIFRIESRNTFTLGILSLATTVLMVAMQRGSLLGQAFAGYTLLLFAVGIVCAAREVRDQRTLTAKKRVAGRRY